MFDVSVFVQYVGKVLDLAGVLIVLGGVIFSTLAVVFAMFGGRGVHDLYRSYRQNLARSILIGLEFLVAGDIIRSVAGDLDLSGVLILGIIVIIRSLLGVEFEMEIEGKWPWQRGKNRI